MSNYAHAMYELQQDEWAKAQMTRDVQAYYASETQRGDFDQYSGYHQSELTFVSGEDMTITDAGYQVNSMGEFGGRMPAWLAPQVPMKTSLSNIRNHGDAVMASMTWRTEEELPPVRPTLTVGPLGAYHREGSQPAALKASKQPISEWDKVHMTKDFQQFQHATDTQSTLSDVSCMSDMTSTDAEYQANSLAVPSWLAAAPQQQQVAAAKTSTLDSIRNCGDSVIASMCRTDEPVAVDVGHPGVFQRPNGHSGRKQAQHGAQQTSWWTSPLRNSTIANMGPAPPEATTEASWNTQESLEAIVQLAAASQNQFYSSQLSANSTGKMRPQAMTFQPTGECGPQAHGCSPQQWSAPRSPCNSRQSPCTTLPPGDFETSSKSCPVPQQHLDASAKQELFANCKWEAMSRRDVAGTGLNKVDKYDEERQDEAIVVMRFAV